MYILSLPLRGSYARIFDMIITRSGFSRAINHFCRSFNKRALVRAPERRSPPWAKPGMRKHTQQFGNIAPIEARVYNEGMGRCTVPTCDVKSFPSHSDKIFELSASRQFLARYMDFGRARGREGGGCLLFDVFLLHSQSYIPTALMCCLKTRPSMLPL